MLSWSAGGASNVYGWSYVDDVFHAQLALPCGFVRAGSARRSLRDEVRELKLDRDSEA